MEKIKIAIQKNGRLYDDSVELLNSCGIKVQSRQHQLKLVAPNFPIEILYLRNSDIPQYLQDGVVDIAIVGENILIEQKKKVNIIERLGFAKCRIALATPKQSTIKNLNSLNGKKIATSYPNILEAFLKNHQITADIHVISGSVEIAPSIGLADAICDIISTGSTLFTNGLKEVHTIMKSEAVLASPEHISKEKKYIVDKLLFRIKAVLKAKNTKYILMNVPNERINQVSQVLPVLKSPTVMPLAKKGWSSLHSVIDEDTFWEIIEKLKSAGAEEILIIPIDKTVL